jgi:hypothetical protein
MANADGAVLQALRPIAAVSLPAVVYPNSTVTLDASGSAAACGDTVVSYHWTVEVPQGAGAPAIQNADSAHASLVSPKTAGTYILSLTVTDDAGRTDTVPVVVTASRATSSAPANAGDSACLTPVNFSVTSGPQSGGGSGTPPASGGGGGGGALELLSLLAGLGVLAWTAGRRYARSCASLSQPRRARG